MYDENNGDKDGGYIGKYLSITMLFLLHVFRPVVIIVSTHPDMYMMLNRTRFQCNKNIVLSNMKRHTKM